MRGLVAGVLALTLPTLAATSHSEVFDFSRAVAVIWLILFVASPLTYGSILVLRRGERVSGGRRWTPAHGWRSACSPSRSRPSAC